MNKIVAGFCGTIGFYFLYNGWFKYGFWRDGAPNGGFIPVIFGALTLVLSIMEIIQSKKEEGSKIVLRQFIPPAVIVLAVFLINILGMLIVLLAMVIAWLRFLERYSYLKSAIIGICVTAFIYGVFVMWLQVPFPTGLLGI